MPNIQTGTTLIMDLTPSSSQKMNNPLAEQLFSEQFKFNINQELRHRGDFKNMNSDMGLFVVRRTIEEIQDSVGRSYFNHFYICRMIKFSGSGELASFTESELMSVSNYERQSIKEQQERKLIHEEMEETMEEVFNLFGVKRKDKVYLIKNEFVDTDVIYKVSGYRYTPTEGAILLLYKVAGQNCNSLEQVEVTSKSAFKLIQL